MNAVAVIEAAVSPAEEWIDRGRTLALLLRYDPETGNLFWLPRALEMFPDERAFKSWNTRYAGKQAFTAKSSAGYHHGAVFGVTISAHRAAWAVHHGEWPSGEVDHINGIRSDNRLANLRDVSTAQNRKNQTRSTANTSGATGVHWCNTWNRWIAKIMVGGKSKSLGHFLTFDEAVEARAKANREMGFDKGHGKERIA
ncbi:HNH endonuclease signature motif containing protein [Sphingobium yanoikuyae]|uniref:HNH endonuclease signature motif containing protein n=1 Tax=Sphingobium yanoikuyae TaxID=13690 RepID=UPI003EFD51CF